ncbi:MAG TPA: indole-3-glycerol phosphate synthase TrpC, partial [Bacteroidota bacterium]|nr:indole-3-glycerol phosphate synthase TrpC [Bacteroidota bacterium]
RIEIARARRRKPLEDVKADALSQSGSSAFTQALKHKGVSIIAEIKRASPSRGVLTAEFDHRQLAREYEEGGARALSVVTDEKFFQGRPAFIQDVKKVCRLPVLRKDFIIDEYQIYESKVLGADAMLLIVGNVDQHTFRRLYDCAGMLGLEVLVEAHTAREVETANEMGAKIIGINNRDLETFQVSIVHSLKLRDKISPDSIAVSESGIRTAEDIEQLQRAQFDAVLIGEGIVARKDRVEALKAMVRA